MCTTSIGKIFTPGNMQGISTGMQIAGLGSQVFGAYRGAQAEIEAAKYQAQVDRNNATIAGWQAKDAISRGYEEERRRRLMTRQGKGASVASMAARGLDVSEGSALNILTDIDMIGEQDALFIRDNAAKEAWGFNVQKQNYMNNPDLLKNRADAISPWKAAGSTLLTGAGQVASSWYRYKNTTTGAPAK